MNINEVFKTQGQPTLTYVNRNNGEFEDKLANAIDSKGLLCLLTGPSKTGKTTLCTKVANAKKLEILQVRCHANLSPSELWRCALEKVNFERVKEVQSQLESSVNSGAELSGNIGWKWLAGLSGKFSTGISSTKTESEIRDKILAEANPDHLLPILKKLPVLFVVEDFHYLLPETQTEVFQQWKTFIDNEVSIIVIGTTHHAADIAFSNKDLIGRIAHIELGRWEQKDLETIAKKVLDILALIFLRLL